MEDEDGAPTSAGKRQKGSGGEAIKKPEFAALSAQEASGGKAEFRRIPVPPHRYTPLRKDWIRIYTPIVEHLKLDIRMNTRNRSVEIKTSQHTDDIDTLQKAADFVRAYLLGFEISDAVALLRVEDLFVDTFQVRYGPPDSRLTCRARRASAAGTEPARPARTPTAQLAHPRPCIHTL